MANFKIDPSIFVDPSPKVTIRTELSASKTIEQSRDSFGGKIELRPKHSVQTTRAQVFFSEDAGFSDYQSSLPSGVQASTEQQRTVVVTKDQDFSKLLLALDKAIPGSWGLRFAEIGPKQDPETNKKRFNTLVAELDANKGLTQSQRAALNMTLYLKAQELNDSPQGEYYRISGLVKIENPQLFDLYQQAQESSVIRKVEESREWRMFLAMLSQLDGTNNNSEAGGQQLDGIVEQVKEQNRIRSRAFYAEHNQRVAHNDNLAKEAINTPDGKLAAMTYLLMNQNEKADPAKTLSVIESCAKDKKA